MVSSAYHNASAWAFLMGCSSLDQRYVRNAEQLERISMDWIPSSELNARHIGLSRILVQSGRANEALALAKSTPLIVELFLTVELGDALWERGDTELALEYWEGVPNLGLYYLRQGSEHLEANRRNSALADFLIGFQIDSSASPQKGQALIEYAELLRQTGDRTLAITVAEKARESGNVLWANRLLGLIYLDLRNYATAEKYFHEAYDLDPTIDRADMWLGVAIARQGRSHEAIAIFTRALELTPDDGLLNFELGRAYLEIENTDRARHYLRKSIEIIQDTDSWDSRYLEMARELLSKLE